MAKIRHIINTLYTCLPKKYKYPIKICKNELDMVSYIIQHTYNKPPTKKEIKWGLNHYKKMLRYGTIIFALSYNPILLNRQALSRKKYAGDNHIIFIILHEIYHRLQRDKNTSYITNEEDNADIFSLELFIKLYKRKNGPIAGLNQLTNALKKLRKNNHGSN